MKREQKVYDLEKTELYLKSIHVQTDAPTKRTTRAWKRLVRQTRNNRKSTSYANNNK